MNMVVYEMVTKLRRDWAWKMHMYLGYRPCEDEDDLRAFNRCIKAIIQSERMKKNKGGNK